MQKWIEVRVHDVEATRITRQKQICDTGDPGEAPDRDP